jgi:glycerophosphoryl diester phosphodiesterase
LLLQKKVCINIEVKVPYDSSIRAKYDWPHAISTLHSLITEFTLNQHSFVSSFNWDALREMERISSAADLHPVRTIYLTNFYNHISLPPVDEILQMGDGLNI